MIDYSNLTNREYFRLNGTLSPERIEYLIELEKAVKDVYLRPRTFRKFVEKWEHYLAKP